MEPAIAEAVVADDRVALPIPTPVAPAAETLIVQGPRRAIFIDVENTSSKGELTGLLDGLLAERGGPAPEIAAIGNWRVVGQDLARALAERGAHLVHSAPVTRVSDWSDLWIAVSAGIWLGRARPGDVLEIISHDRAFDAVGDAAARLGVVYRRVTYRPTAGGRKAPVARRAPEPVAHRVPEPVAAAGEEPHSAPLEQIQDAIATLTRDNPEAGVTLDALTMALKAAGFQRPQGSPRLVTRLRRMKGVEISRDGRVRLVRSAEEAGPAEPAAAASPGKGRRRRSRRGGRRRGRRRGAAAS